MPINGSLHAIFCLNSTDDLGQVSSDFDYDHTNQLTGVTLVNRSGESYGYDASNQWVAKQVTAGTGTPSLSYYIYDGGQIVLDFDGTEVSDLDHRYLWGPNVDQLLAAETVTSTSVDGDVHYPLTDNLGSVRDLFDPNSGAVEKHFYYDSFGNLTTVSDYNTPTESLLFGYTGRMFDSNTGLQNNLNRWYDPTIGRWISKDPIGFAAGDSNLYRYVGNSPTNATDPSGEVVVFPYPIDLPPWFQLPTFPNFQLPSLPSHCDVVARIIEATIFRYDANGRRFWNHFTSGSSRELKLSNADMKSIASKLDLAPSNGQCKDGEQFEWGKTLEDPWKTSIGGASLSIAYRCESNACGYDLELSDRYDWKSILRDFQTHRSIWGQIVTLGFDFVQTITRCTSMGKWANFEISGSISGTTSGCCEGDCSSSGEVCTDWQCAE